MTVFSIIIISNTYCCFAVFFFFYLPPCKSFQHPPIRSPTQTFLAFFNTRPTHVQISNVSCPSADLTATPSMRTAIHYPTWLLTATRLLYEAHHRWMTTRTPSTTHRSRGKVSSGWIPFSMTFLLFSPSARLFVRFVLLRVSHVICSVLFS